MTQTSKWSGLTGKLFAAAIGLAVALPGAAAIARAIKKGGTLVVAINDNPPDFITGLGTNILTITTGGQIFDTLIKVDNKFNVVPSLAKSWEQSADGLQVTFHLEPNVTWHDGKPFTSADVKFSLLELNAKYNSLATAAYKDIASIEAPDPLTVVVRAKAPDPSFFPWAFSQPNFAQIFPKHIYETGDPKTNPANVKPIGTGPFMFKDWARGQSITLERNPKYFHADKIYVDRLIFQIIPDGGAREIALEKGDIDHIPYFGLSTSSIDPLSKAKGTEVIDSMRPALGQIMMHFNLRNKPLSDKAVRQAITYAIDRDVLVKLALNGHGVASTSPIRSDQPPFYNKGVKKYPRNVATANKLLDDAGYKRNGSAPRFSLKLIYEGVGEGGALQAAGEIMREQLKDVGIDLQLGPSDAAAWQEATVAWNFDLSMNSYGTGPDPKIGVSRAYTSDNIKHVLGANMEGYNNPKIDDLFTRADKEMNVEARTKLYYEIQDILVEDMPILWLWEKSYPIAIRKGLSGLPAGSMHSEVFESVGWTQ